VEKPFIVIITIIAALILLGIIFAISGMIDIEGFSNVLFLEEKEEEFTTTCPMERLSPEQTFFSISGDCGKYESSGDPFCNDKCGGLWGACCQDERNSVQYRYNWQCNVPGVGDGACIIERFSQKQYVYNSCKETCGSYYVEDLSVFGFTLFDIYRGTDSTGNLEFEEQYDCSIGPRKSWEICLNPCCSCECLYEAEVYPSEYVEKKYDEGEDLYFEAYFYLGLEKGSDIDCFGGDTIAFCGGKEVQEMPHLTKEEFHHYTVSVRGRYCCPDGYLWNENLKECSTTPTKPCDDTDGGKNYFEEGSLTIEPDTYNDVCNSGVLTEYYCENMMLKSATYECPLGCDGNACKEDMWVASDPDGFCWDSDGGLNYFSKGYGGGGPVKGDACDGNTLLECTCAYSDSIGWYRQCETKDSVYVCPNSCECFPPPEGYYEDTCMCV